MAKYDFKKLTFEQMKDYIKKNAPEDKEWFINSGYVSKPKRVAEPQFNEDGSPIMITSKSGKVHQKVKMVPVASGETLKSFSMFDAKLAFCQRYMPEIMPKAKENTKSIAWQIENW